MTELNYTASEISTTEYSVKSSVESAYLGSISFEKSIELQKDLGKLAQSRNSISILGLQHPAVITLGRRAQQTTELSDQFLQSNSSIPVLHTSRGGLATIHSEGQLIIYPVLNLRKLKWGVQNYVSRLLLTTQSLLVDYGILSEIDIKGAGLYTATGKIAFCGIEVRSGITYHGISLNVRNDLGLFSMIRSCGIENLKLDQLQNYQVNDTLKEIFEKWVSIFKRSLNEDFNQ